MKIRGKKIICAHCGTKFYDFNRSNVSCPKCKKVQIFDSVKKKTQNHKLDLDLFFCEDKKLKKVITLQSKLININIQEDLQIGWYIISNVSLESGIIENFGELIFLNTPPLKGFQQVLSSYRFPGVGSEISKRIIQNPNFTFSLLKKKSTSIGESLNVSLHTARAISTGWMIKTNEVIQELIFRELNFTTSQIKSIHDNIGNDIFFILRKNASDLLGQIPRITFEQINSIYERLNLKPSESDFAVTATKFWLTKTEDRRGHTCAPKQKVIEEASKISNINKILLEEYIDKEPNTFHTASRFNKEIIISSHSFIRDQSVDSELKRIKKHYDNKKIKSLSKAELKMPKNIDISDEQLKAINLSLKHSISIITGGPGSGKSTLIVGLVKGLKLNKKKIIICAPTGRAAKRLSEYKDLKALEPSTIHMHLVLAKNKQKSNYDTIIIDEASMIDINLFVELLKSVPSGSGIVFVGDADQLPPIGPGQPFKDIIESGVFKTSKLSGNYRQDNLSDIIKASRSIILGKIPILNQDLNESDFIFLECEKEKQRNTILSLYFNQIPKTLGNKETIQILSPMHKGEVGIKFLNENIQNKLTRNNELVFEKKDKSLQLNIGDKVIQTTNNYDLMVMNGDIGIVEKKIDKEVIVSFDNREVSYSGLDLYDLDLAYAISIHKSQGSEYPGIIIPINSDHIHMLSRNLLYTGITRGKKLVVLVGDLKIFKYAINSFWKDTRYTNLVSTLKENEELI